MMRQWMGNVISIGGKKFSKGLGTHANRSIELMESISGLLLLAALMMKQEVGWYGWEG
ncbi:MAG: hypothetical protein DRP92_00795 [Candidatus Neomarinimicrobiota bacterium]|nr:MAG: hypothetical protein DRP92_00795 [Candidatus Neomarinimicrobiota bacterium]